MTSGKRAKQNRRAAGAPARKPLRTLVGTELDEGFLLSMAFHFRREVERERVGVGGGLAGMQIFGVNPINDEWMGGGGSVRIGGSCYLVCDTMARKVRTWNLDAEVVAVDLDASDVLGRNDVVDAALWAKVDAAEWPGASSHHRVPPRLDGASGHCVVVIGERWFVDPTVGQYRDKHLAYEPGTQVAVRGHEVFVQDQLAGVLPEGGGWAETGELVVRAPQALLLYRRNELGLPDLT